MEFQLLNQQIKQSQEQLETLQQQFVELTVTSQNLDDLNNVKAGTEALVQMNSGIFIKTAIKDNKEVIVNVGGGIAVKKDIASTKELIGDQIDEIKKIQQNKLISLQEMADKANLLEKEINEAVKNKG